MSSYKAPWWLPGGHLQTIYAALAPAPRVSYRRERWETPDGDFIDLDWAGPESTDGNSPVLALFHGLEGSSASPYARAIAARAIALGFRCVVAHFRGCSGELNRLPRAYHSGDSEEIGWILEALSARTGTLHACGISLGGNALLKYLGEQGENAAPRKAIAISAPLDLAAACGYLYNWLSREIYTRIFMRTLKKKTFAKLEREQISVDARRLRNARTFWEFDDTVTAPLHGFLGADDYWARASSGPWLGGIRVPTLVLNARNDPFMPETALDAIRDVPPNVVLEFPRSGGHAGFPGRNHWLARRVVDFLSAP